MVRRPYYPFNGKRFIGNTDEYKVHDLDNEDTAENGCQIDEINDEHIKTFIPDKLEQAHKEGFKDCQKCIGIEIEIDD